jgi:hypothetical protein
MKSHFGHKSRKRAVENTLHRLGMQAKPEEVVAALAQQGIEVSEDFVRLVRIGLLKAADRSRAQPPHPHTHAARPQVRRRTTPAPRTRR